MALVLSVLDTIKCLSILPFAIRLILLLARGELERDIRRQAGFNLDWSACCRWTQMREIISWQAGSEELSFIVLTKWKENRIQGSTKLTRQVKRLTGEIHRGTRTERFWQRQKEAEELKHNKTQSGELEGRRGADWLRWRRERGRARRGRNSEQDTVENNNRHVKEDETRRGISIITRTKAATKELWHPSLLLITIQLCWHCAKS